MTSCFCLQGRRAGQTQHPSHPVLFSGMLLAALTLQSVPMASSPSPKKGRKSSSMRHLKRKSGLQSPGQPQHTCTHTQAWNGKLTRKSHETIRPHSMSICQLAMLWQPAWPHCLPPPQPCGLSPRTVLGTVPWRPWLLLGGLGKRWNEESEIALSARS